MRKGSLITITVKKVKGGHDLYIGERALDSGSYKETKTGCEVTVRSIEIFDSEHLSVPKDFEQMHQELFQVIGSIGNLNKLYRMLMAIDHIRQKYFKEYDIAPYYLYGEISRILLDHGACMFVRGTLQKTELFSRFLMLREEMLDEHSTVGKSAVKSVNKIVEEQEKAGRTYQLPSVEDLQAMSYEMITLEIAQAEERLAKPRIIKILKDKRREKTPDKSKKSDTQMLKEVLAEDAAVAEPLTKLAVHQKKKEAKLRKEDAKYRKPTPRVKVAAIAKDEEYLDEPS